MMMMGVIPILTIMSLALKKEQVDISSFQAIVVSTNRKRLLKARMANSCLRFYQAKKSNGKITQLKSTQVQQLESVREIPLPHLTQSPAEIPWRIHRCG